MSDLVSSNATLEKLATGMKFTEGPVWFEEEGGYLVFSDIPANELKCWSAAEGLSTFRTPSHNANGNTRDLDGLLISCEHGSRQVTRTRADGAVEVVAESFEGKRFNSPNDAVVKSDGTIWFTDPPYGLSDRTQKELDKHYVFRMNADGAGLTVVVDDFDMPNGLCFSPDEKKLYIADSGKPHHIRVFDVQADGTLRGGEVFCVIDKGVPDGIRCDSHGNIWSSAGDGVQIFGPDGSLVGRIAVPEAPANLCFGGPDGTTLFMTSRTSLYAIETQARGAAR
jgi:gluconolactonase